MITIERTITIHRPVDEVFAYLSGVEHGPQYISGQRPASRPTGPPMLTTNASCSGMLRRRELQEHVCLRQRPYGIAVDRLFRETLAPYFASSAATGSQLLPR